MRCDQGADAHQRGLRRQCQLLVAAAQDAEQAAQLTERLAPGVLDGGDRCARALGIGRDGALGGGGLDEHDRDVVGDDVVQLARDPGSLAEHRRLLALGAVVLDLACLLVEAAVERVARAQHPAREGRDAHRHDRHPGDAADSRSPGAPFDQRGRREQADRRDGADDQIARRTRAARPGRRRSRTGRPRPASASSRRPPRTASSRKSRSTASRLASGARHAKTSGTGVRQREDDRDGADAGVVDERRLGELREREQESRARPACARDRARAGRRP